MKVSEFINSLSEEDKKKDLCVLDTDTGDHIPVIPIQDFINVMYEKNKNKEFCIYDEKTGSKRPVTQEDISNYEDSIVIKTGEILLFA